MFVRLIFTTEAVFDAEDPEEFHSHRCSGSSVRGYAAFWLIHLWLPSSVDKE